MSMNVNNYGGIYTGKDYTAKNVKEPVSAAEGSLKAKEADQAAGKSNVKLSEKAQAMLEKLKKTYGNMDFMVANFSSSEEAKEILSRGTKEFSVLFSAEELEKMASDEKYEKEYMEKINGAVRMSEKIGQQFALMNGDKNGEKGELTRVGIAFNSDGSTTLFAELEKTTNKQAERIEKAKEKKAEAKKAEEKKTTAKQEPKKTTVVQADTQEELIEKLHNLDWNKVTSEKKTEGGKIDFTI